MTSSLLLQLVSTVCGIILPRLFITGYGSAVNGTISSVTQFLSFIVLFEAGVGGVVRAALYKPLSDNDNAKISSVIKAADIFFRKIALIFVAYTIVVAVVFPLIIDRSFDFYYTFTLVLIIAFSTFTQYYFGLSCQIILNADQRRYIYSLLQVFTVTLNTVVVVILIKSGASIHIVKLATALIYTIRPLVLRLYVKLHYHTDPHAIPDKSALDKKWDGFGHHTAFFLHSNTDVAVLTVAASLTNRLTIADISVYTVYYTIVAGMKNLVSAVSSGIEAAFGNMIAKGETEALKKNFRLYEFISFALSTVTFTCVGILLVPFIRIYTSGVTDASYNQPLFAVIITLAEAVYCIRIPYNNVTLAAGHYHETRNGAFIEAGINIALSFILVFPLGLCGVAVATLVAMLFRTVQYAVYLSSNILHTNISVFIKRCIVSTVCAALSILAVKLIPFTFVKQDYFTWFVYALITFCITTVITAIINLIFYRRDFLGFISILKNIFERK